MELVAKFWTKYTLTAVGRSLKLGILKMKGSWTLETAPEKLESLHNPAVFLSISCPTLGDYGCSSGQLVAEAGRGNCGEAVRSWGCNSVGGEIAERAWSPGFDLQYGVNRVWRHTSILRRKIKKFKIILSYTVNLRLAGIHETLSQKTYNKSIK